MFNFDEIWAHLKKPGVVGKFEAFGDIFQYAISWSAIAAVALVGTHEQAWIWLYGSLITVLLTTAGKHTFNFTKYGTRPNGGDQSFPSGHTSGAFGGAAFWLFTFGWVWAAIPIALAVLTGLSRVAAKKHWPRDVVAGALLATGVMWYFTTYGLPSCFPVLG